MSNFLILHIPILLLLLPLIFQIIVGNKQLRKSNYFVFGLISFSSIIWEVVMTIVGLIISLQGQLMKGIRGASPGFILYAMPFIIFLILMIVIQILLRNKMKK